MAIYLSRKKGGTVATPITPSNSSPAQMTANVAVNPTANGYAIASYDTIFPAAVNPEQIEYGKIYQALSDGYAIGSQPIEIIPSNSSPVSIERHRVYIAGDFGYAIEYYDNVTPSSTPTSVSSGDIVKIGGSGVIVNSIPTPTSITPSNSSPVALSANNPVTPTASGYAISSYSSKTPSDSSPASVSSGAIIKASASGYLYASSGLGKCKSGTFTSSTSSQTINLGFQPKYILIMSTALTTNIYDYSYSSTKGIYATANAGATEYTISGNTSNNHISAISSTGFTFNKSGSSGTTIYYFAIG